MADASSHRVRERYARALEALEKDFFARLLGMMAQHPLQQTQGYLRMVAGRVRNPYFMPNYGRSFLELYTIALRHPPEAALRAMQALEAMGNKVAILNETVAVDVETFRGWLESYRQQALRVFHQTLGDITRADGAGLDLVHLGREVMRAFDFYWDTPTMLPAPDALQVPTDDRPGQDVRLALPASWGWPRLFLHPLDEGRYGFRRSGLVLLQGASGRGKTTLTLALAAAMLLENPHAHLLLLTTEMTTRELLARLLKFAFPGEAGEEVWRDRLASRDLGQKHWEFLRRVYIPGQEVHRGMDLVTALELLVQGAVQARLRGAQDLIAVVDFIQMISVPRQVTSPDPEVQHILHMAAQNISERDLGMTPLGLGVIAYALTYFAAHYGVLVLVVSQVNREGQSYGSDRPYHAAMLAFNIREHTEAPALPPYLSPQDVPDERPALLTLQVAKNRFGPTSMGLSGLEIRLLVGHGRGLLKDLTEIPEERTEAIPF